MCSKPRGYVRKALETYFTFLIEVIWGKKRILEVYANVAEMGKLTFGVEAASQRFYGISAAKLSRKISRRIAKPKEMVSRKTRPLRQPPNLRHCSGHSAIGRSRVSKRVAVFLTNLL
jgi:membrane carboxypeptidase/penicillin-binding protein